MSQFFYEEQFKEAMETLIKLKGNKNYNSKALASSFSEKFIQLF